MSIGYFIVEEEETRERGDDRRPGDSGRSVG